MFLLDAYLVAEPSQPYYRCINNVYILLFIHFLSRFSVPENHTFSHYFEPKLIPIYLILAIFINNSSQFSRVVLFPFLSFSHTHFRHTNVCTCLCCAVQTACRCITRLRVPSPVLLFPPLLSVTLSRSTSSHPPSVGLTTYWKMRKIILSFSCTFLFHPSQAACRSCSSLCSGFPAFCPLIFLSLPSVLLLALISLF